MLPDGCDVGVIRRCIERIAVLKRKTITVIHIDIAIRYIMHEQTPEQIACYHRVTQILSRLDRGQELS